MDETREAKPGHGETNKKGLSDSDRSTIKFGVILVVLFGSFVLALDTGVLETIFGALPAVIMFVLVVGAIVAGGRFGLWLRKRRVQELKRRRVEFANEIAAASRASETPPTTRV